MNTMKHIFSLILTLAVVLSALSGCSAAEKQSPAPADAEPPASSADPYVGPWHLADDTDLEALSEVFPGAAEFGSGMEIRADGGISWYVGADGAAGTYVMEGDALLADVTGELDGQPYRVTLSLPEPDRLAMTFKDAALVWIPGAGESLRGED